MILNIVKQDNPKFPHIADVLIYGRVRQIGTSNSIHLLKRIKELHKEVLLTDAEYEALLQGFPDFK